MRVGLVEAESANDNGLDSETAGFLLVLKSTDCELSSVQPCANVAAFRHR